MWERKQFIDSLKLAEEEIENRLNVRAKLYMDGYLPLRGVHEAYIVNTVM